MKYLNEAKHISELQEICREHLIDLVDKGFEVDMSYHGYLMIEKPKQLFEPEKEIFQWSEVADQIINFVEVFRDELEIHMVTVDYRVTTIDQYDEEKVLELPHILDMDNLESVKIRNIVMVKIKMWMTK